VLLRVQVHRNIPLEVMDRLVGTVTFGFLLTQVNNLADTPVTSTDSPLDQVCSLGSLSLNHNSTDTPLNTSDTLVKYSVFYLSAN
jgi:hypothetical protein